VLSHQALDHSVVHQDFHAGRVRIVRNDELTAAMADFSVLFPRDTVLTTAIGCRHTCLYTDQTPPSLVAERIAEHLREFDHAHEPSPAHPRGSEPQGLGKGAWM
jgi:hypothetical protein